MNDATHRAYEILACLGRGAFAEVYHAQAQGVPEAEADVALKIARSNVDSSTLARFRDEARILALLEDPAVVSAAAPRQIDGHWVMVMEYVDGATVKQMMVHELFPPRAAVEILAEVTRALDKAHHQPGPYGEPLALVHRDLKPGNLMVTRDGQVKVLDFGIARAEFPNREADTMGTFVGTPGYIAPERVRGVDGPSSDIYSLGVLLHVLVTGQPANEVDVEDLTWTEGGALDAVLKYARTLRAAHPFDRPTAAEVAEHCRAWAETIPGADLLTFAKKVVPRSQRRFTAPLVGHVLGATRAPTPLPLERSLPVLRHEPLPPSPPPAPPRWTFVGVAVGVSVVGLMAAALIGLAVVWQAAPSSRSYVAPSPRLADQEKVVRPPVRPTRSAPVKPDPVPVPRTPPPPVTAPTEAPKPAPAAARLEPVSFFSQPPGAEVLIDGVVVGRTPLRDHPVSVGNCMLAFRRGNETVRQSVRVGGRHGARAFTWTPAGVVAE
ncbi:MAG: serine/threonine-protein kinase [Myxococcota bacterium]